MRVLTKLAGAAYIIGIFIFFSLQFYHAVRYAVRDPEQRVAETLGVRLPKPSRASD